MISQPSATFDCLARSFTIVATELYLKIEMRSFVELQAKLAIPFTDGYTIRHGFHVVLFYTLFTPIDVLCNTAVLLLKEGKRG